ncbi:hypothetical protein Hanom_Chr14g01315431 [Helianthus anomalus]
MVSWMSRANSEHCTHLPLVLSTGSYQRELGNLPPKNSQETCRYN